MWKNTIFLHLIKLMNERQSLHHSQSKVICRNFFGLWLRKHRKIVSLTDSDVQTLLAEEENQNTIRKTESYVFSDFGNGISRRWERKSTTGKYVTSCFWLFTWKISVGQDQVNNWDFWMLKIRPIVCFCGDSKHVSILSLNANALHDFYSGIVDPFIFIY